MISTCASTATRRRRRVTRVLRQSRALCEKPRFLLPPVPSFLCYHCPHKSVQESGRREGGRHGGAISRVGTAETEPVEAVSSGGGRQRPRLLYHGAPAPAYWGFSLVACIRFSSQPGSGKASVLSRASHCPQARRAPMLFARAKPWLV